jgi:hypothetical protein
MRLYAQDRACFARLCTFFVRRHSRYEPHDEVRADVVFSKSDTGG